MNKVEKKRLSAVLRATEYLFLENIALKLVLEHRAVANWQKLLDHLLTDKEMLAGVRLKFSDFYREIGRSQDPSSALESFFGWTSRIEEAAQTTMSNIANYQHSVQKVGPVMKF